LRKGIDFKNGEGRKKAKRCNTKKAGRGTAKKKGVISAIRSGHESSPFVGKIPEGEGGGQRERKKSLNKKSLILRIKKKIETIALKKGLKK